VITYANYTPTQRPTLEELIELHPTEAIEVCERLADEMDERGRHADGEMLRDLVDIIAAL
jgi:hypothetical protein